MKLKLIGMWMTVALAAKKKHHILMVFYLQVTCIFKSIFILLQKHDISHVNSCYTQNRLRPTTCDQKCRLMVTTTCARPIFKHWLTTVSHFGDHMCNRHVLAPHVMVLFGQVGQVYFEYLSSLSNNSAHVLFHVLAGPLWAIAHRAAHGQAAWHLTRVDNRQWQRSLLPSHHWPQLDHIATILQKSWLPCYWSWQDISRGQHGLS